MLSAFSAFRRSQAGTSVVELAMILPLLLVTFFAALEFNRFLMFQRRGEMATVFAAEYLSRDDDNVLTTREHRIWQDVWMIVNPSAFDGEQIRVTERGGRVAIGYSRWATSVDFERDPDCDDEPCDFLPNPLWSLGTRDRSTGGSKRDCELDVVPDSFAHSRDTIRAGEVGRSPVIIVDMAFRYDPILSNPFLPSHDMRFTEIRSTRSGLPLNTDPGQSRWNNVQCSS